MSIDRKLLEILCCPVTKDPVLPLSAERLASLNQCVEQGEVAYVDGKPVEQPLREALIRQDEQVIYRIDDGIPVMLAELGIGTTQLAGKASGF